MENEKDWKRNAPEDQNERNGEITEKNPIFHLIFDRGHEMIFSFSVSADSNKKKAAEMIGPYRWLRKGRVTGGNVEIERNKRSANVTQLKVYSLIFRKCVAEEKKIFAVREILWGRSNDEVGCFLLSHSAFCLR